MHLIFHDEHPLLINNVLNPLDSFFGGRTVQSMQYYKTRPGEKILFYDYFSLHPSVCKFGKYCVKHPNIFIGDECFEVTGENYYISNINGLIKCIILPPRQLLFLVLPVKMHNLLLFPFCHTCTENNVQEDCPHEHPVTENFSGHGRVWSFKRQ